MPVASWCGSSPSCPASSARSSRSCRPSADESAQFRLFDAYTNFLRAAADDSPLMIVLDDIHWADKPTLLLLQHLAREVHNVRILLVGTYRDTELARTHPLSEALAELNREGGFQRVVLRGLDEPEVRAYLAATTGREPARELVTSVYEETEGNPFFLSEVVNLLAEEGTLDRSVSDIALPDGVREALGRRLDRLSEEANELLTMASVVGREFEYETLKLLTEHDDDTLLALLEEGLAARVVEELDRPGRFRFSHALMQETLLAELSTTRRVRLHGQVAEALEARYGERAARRAAELALHFLESATLNAVHAAKAIDYSVLAAEAAEGRAAWAEAARLYANARVLTEGASRAASRRHQITVGWARALRISLQLREAWQVVMSGLDEMRGGDDVETFAEACLEAAELPAAPERRFALLSEALESKEQLPDTTRARVLALRATLRPEDAALDADVAEAQQIAEALGLVDVSDLVRHWRTSRLVAAGRLREALAQATGTSDPAGGVGVLRHALGDLEGAEQIHARQVQRWARLNNELITEAYATGLFNVAAVRFDRAAMGPRHEVDDREHLRYQERARMALHGRGQPGSRGG